MKQKKQTRQDSFLQKNMGVFYRVEQHTRENKWWNAGWQHMVEAALFILFIYGIFGSFVTGMEFPIYKTIFYLGICLVAMVDYGIFFIAKQGERGLIIFAIFTGGFGFCKRRSIAQGLAICVNTYLQHFSDYYNYQILQYHVQTEQVEKVTTIFCIFVAIFLIGIFAYFYHSKNGKWIFCGLGLLLVLLPETVGKVSAVAPSIVFVITLLLLFSVRDWQYKDGAAGKKMLLQQGILAVCLLGLLLCLLPASTYKKKLQYSIYKEKIQHFMECVTTGNFTGKRAKGGINAGMLGKVGEVVYEDTDQMRVTMHENKSIQRTQYFPGFIGSNYKGTKWQDLDKQQKKQLQQIEKTYDVSVENIATQVAEIFSKKDLVSNSGNIFSPCYKNMYQQRLQNCEEDQGQMNQLCNQFFLENVGGEGFNERFQQFFGAEQAEKNIYAIENIAETSKTKFIPYFATTMWENKNGYLHLEEHSKNGFYQISSFPQLGEQENRIYPIVSNTDFDERRPEALWAEIEEEKQNWEDVVNQTYMADDPAQQQRQTGIQQRISQDQYITLTSSTLENFYCQALAVHEKQQAYEQFVKAAYCQVPEQLQKPLQKICRQYDLKAQGNIQESVYRLLAFFETHTKYSLAPGKTPRDQDFVLYFLQENKEGYCVHYASAATLLLRTMGIPCRYVEGYMLDTSSQLPEVDQEKRTCTYVLKDCNAHAWVEVYISGYGWVPLEVTNGYSDKTILSQFFAENQTTATALPQIEQDMRPDNTATVTEGETAKETIKPSENSGKNGTFMSGQADAKQNAGVRFEIGLAIMVVMVSFCVVFVLYYFGKRKKVELPLQEQECRLQQSIEKWLRKNQYMTGDQVLREEALQGGFAVPGATPKEWVAFGKILTKSRYSEAGITKEELQQCKDFFDKLRSSGGK